MTLAVFIEVVGLLIWWKTIPNWNKYLDRKYGRTKTGNSGKGLKKSCNGREGILCEKRGGNDIEDC